MHPKRLIPGFLAGIFLVLPLRAAATGCEPAFPYQDGWLGGDAAYSVPLPVGAGSGEERTLWLFGDSFVGRKNQKVRGGTKMVGNSIGVSTCRDGRWEIRYLWNEMHSGGDERAYFHGDGFRYWPLDGFVHKGRVHVFLAKVRNVDDGGFGFDYFGVRVARISKISRPPEDWSVDILQLTDDDFVFPGVSVNVQGDHAVLYSVIDGPGLKGHHMILTRVALNSFEGDDADPSVTLEYLGTDGKWHPGLERKKARVVMENGHTELSVRYHPPTRQWIALKNGGGFPAQGVLLRTAPALEGPWTEGKILHRFEETSGAGGETDRDTFCYAVKEHPQFRKGREILITYACNSFKFGKLAENLGIYRPVPVRITLPQ